MAGTDVVVVGGGLAGLAGATLLARSGAHVRLFEKGRDAGGRARSERFDGFTWNQGAHALYKGDALELLRELGIEVRGGEPALAGFAVKGGVLHKLPATPMSIATTSLLGARDKLQLTQALSWTLRSDFSALRDVPLSTWLSAQLPSSDARAAFEMIFRVSTYLGDPWRITAGDFLAQLKAATKNVIYLDGGWQAIVDALREKALAAGVAITTGVKAEEVVLQGGAAHGVRLVGGEVIPARAVLLAVPPADAAALVPGNVSLALAAERKPVQAACLDLALSRLPVPEHRFALGVDRPFYFSVHSGVARLAPEGSAVIHLMSYEPAALGGEAALRAELEAFAELLQPRWRDVLVRERFAPHMTVAGNAPEPAHGGIAGRSPVRVPGIEGLCVAGDWVGARGLLADASMASAREAAAALSARKERAVA